MCLKRLALRMFKLLTKRQNLSAFRKWKWTNSNQPRISSSGNSASRTTRISLRVGISKLKDVLRVNKVGVGLQLEKNNKDCIILSRTKKKKLIFFFPKKKKKKKKK